MIVKAGALVKGPNTRFVVTNRPDPPPAVYAWSTARGQTENWIKDWQRVRFADRLSCHRFRANQVRRLLHAAADCLLDAVRRWLKRAGRDRRQLDTPRPRLIKVGGRVRQLAARVHLRLAASHPGAPLRRSLIAMHDRS